jgi:hypothetical protein
MPNPSGKDSDNEWIMLENREKKTVNLKDFGVATGWKNLSNHPVREDFIIAPKSEAKLTRTHSLFTLPNQKGEVELRAPDGKVLQAIKYKLEKSAAENAIYNKEKGKHWTWQESGEGMAGYDAAPAEEPQVLPETSGAPEEEILGAATEIASDRPGTAPPEKLSAPVPGRPRPISLLYYGTHIRLPETIPFTPADLEPETASLPTSEHYAAAFATELLSDINASLNELLNRSAK